MEAADSVCEHSAPLSLSLLGAKKSMSSSLSTTQPAILRDFSYDLYKLNLLCVYGGFLLSGVACYRKYMCSLSSSGMEVVPTRRVLHMCHLCIVPQCERCRWCYQINSQLLLKCSELVQQPLSGCHGCQQHPAWDRGQPGWDNCTTANVLPADPIPCWLWGHVPHDPHE